MPVWRRGLPEYLAKKNLIENCEVKMNVSTIYNNVSYVAGLVAIAKNTAIKNSNVTSLKVVDPTAFVDINFNLSYVTNVAGAVGQLFNAELENCTSNGTGENRKCLISAQIACRSFGGLFCLYPP